MCKSCVSYWDNSVHLPIEKLMCFSWKSYNTVQYALLACLKVCGTLLHDWITVASNGLLSFMRGSQLGIT